VDVGDAAEELLLGLRIAREISLAAKDAEEIAVATRALEELLEGVEDLGVRRDRSRGPSRRPARRRRSPRGLKVVDAGGADPEPAREIGILRTRRRATR
jgi:hypothetical protein